MFNNATAQAPKPQAANDPFGRIEQSDPSQGGIYPEAGLYPCLYVQALKMIRSRKGEDLFIAEFDIIESMVQLRPKGTKMSWAVNFRHDASPGNVKSFLAALMGVDPGAVDAEGSRHAVSENNPCRGRLIRLEAVQVKTKAGNDFTRCNWTALPDEIQQQAEQLRADAGFVN